MSLALLAVAACGEGADGPAFAVRDSAGIRIVESFRPAWEEGGAWRLSAAPVGILGPELPDGGFVFGARYGAALPDGGFVVGNAQARELLFVERDGTLGARAGRDGDGPGEFTAMFGLDVCDDGTIGVMEVHRLSFWSPAGEFLRTERVSGRLSSGRAALVALSPDCRRALLRSSRYEVPGPGDRLGYAAGTLFWASLDGSGADTVPGGERGLEAVAVDIAGLGRSWMRRPFGSGQMVVEREGRVLLGRTHRASLHRTGGAAADPLMLRWGTPSRARTDDDLAGALRDHRAFLEDLPAEEHRYYPAPDLLSPAEELPLYSDLRVGVDGSVWLRHWGGYVLGRPDEPDWTVLSSDGRWLGTSTLPPGRELLAVGRDALLMSVADSLDVERIEVWGLDRGAGSGG